MRNRGTVGGSLAHADPAAELPGVAVTCDAEIILVGPDGTRVVRAADIFTGALSTMRRPDEIVTELRLPGWRKRQRWAFQEFAPRRRDFALAGVALFYNEDDCGRIHDAHMGVIGAGDRPQRLPTVEALLNDQLMGEELMREAAALPTQAVEPPADLHADGGYRRALIGTLVARSLRAAQVRDL
jgi:aerobic carbon-monoxide dehydrogenase medium subunit